MKTYTQKIQVDKRFAKKVQKHMDDNIPLNDKIGRNDQGYETFTAKFGNGIESDIKVFDSPNGPWIDPVLFTNGNEIVTLEAQYVLLGEYPFEYKGNKYIVKLFT